MESPRRKKSVPKQSVPVIKERKFSDVFGENMAYELLKQQSRYKDAEALCRTNKLIASVCSTQRAQSILKILEAEDSLASFLNLVKPSGLGWDLLYYSKEGPVVRLEPEVSDSMPGWKKFINERRISKRLYGALTSKEANPTAWHNAVVEAMSDHPLKVNGIFQTPDNTRTVPTFDILAAMFFDWEETSVISSGELMQMLNTFLLTSDEFHITVEYDRWIHFFQVGMSKIVPIFRQGVWM